MPSGTSSGPTEQDNVSGRPVVYVVNSDPAFLEMIGELLADARVQVQLDQLSYHIEHTLDQLREIRPALLILDIVPGRDEPVQLLDQIQQSADLQSLPIMLASTSPGLAESAANMHPHLVRDVLPKPFDLEVFYTKLAKLVSGARVP